MEDSIDRLFAEWEAAQVRYDATSDAAEVLRLGKAYCESQQRLERRIGPGRSAVEGTWTYQVIDGEGRSQGCRWITRRPIGGAVA